MNLRCSDWFYKSPTKRSSTVLYSTVVQPHCTKVTCSAIWGLRDKDDDLRASHELLNTVRISLDILNKCCDMTS